MDPGHPPTPTSRPAATPQARCSELAGWLSGRPILPGDEAAAEVVWGTLSAATARRGRPHPVDDMWIAACCITHQVPLAMLNLRDYQEFTSTTAYATHLTPARRGAGRRVRPRCSRGVYVW